MLDKLFWSCTYIFIFLLIMTFIIPDDKWSNKMIFIRKHLGNCSFLGAIIVKLIDIWI